MPLRKHQLHLLFVCVISLCFSLSANGQNQVVEKTYLTTDKEIYQPEDTLWFKGYVFNRLNVLSDESIALHVLVTTEDGKKLRDGSWKIEQGLSHGHLVVPRQEGKYFLSAFSGKMIGVSTEQVFTKEIYVRSGIADEISLLANIDSTSNSVQFQARLSEKEAASRERFTYEFWSDTEKLDRGAVRTDTAGYANIDIADYLDSDISLLIKSTDNDLANQIQLSIPLKANPKSIDLQFFPEGGGLIKGVASRVAFKAIDNNGTPFDFKGILTDESGNVLDTVSSTYAGMGAFFFTPTNEVYGLKILQPSSFDTLYALPKPIESGVAIAIVRGTDKEPLLRLTPGLTDPSQKIKVQFSQYEEAVSTAELSLDHRRFIPIPLAEFYPGIAKITISSEEGAVLSERLFFANPDEQLQIKIETDKDFYLPRDSTIVNLTITDIDGKPVQGNFSLSAIDDTRARSPNEHQPNLMAQILLKSELRGSIPTPNYYFNGSKEAKYALDLVMLTHGWRKHLPSPFLDPEALMGELIHRKSKKKVIANTELSLFSLENFDSDSVTVDEKGRFYITSSMFKAKGDSFLLSSVVGEKNEKPNIKPNDSTRLNLINFKQSIAKAIDQSSLVPDFSIFQKDNKVLMDEFQSTLILNTVTVSARRYSENPCALSEIHFEYPWKTKTVDELDLTNLDIVTLAKQVHDEVKGYGMVKTDKLIDPSEKKPTSPGFESITYPLIHGLDALLSYDLAVSPPMGLPKFYRTIPYLVVINCKPVAGAINGSVFGKAPVARDYQHRSTLEGIDFRNIESISVRNSGVHQKPMIMINTVDARLIYKPRLQKYLTFATYLDDPIAYYEPKYDTPEKRDLAIPDMRTTIHWEHSIVTDENGQAKISFYNADRSNRIRITVEGLNNDSEFGFAQKDYRIASLGTKGN